jgi:hypothetical protein
MSDEWEGPKTWASIKKTIEERNGYLDDADWKEIRYYILRLNCLERGKMSLDSAKFYTNDEYISDIREEQLEKMEMYKSPEYIQELAENQKSQMEQQKEYMELFKKQRLDSFS